MEYHLKSLVAECTVSRERRPDALYVLGFKRGCDLYDVRS